MRSDYLKRVLPIVTASPSPGSRKHVYSYMVLTFPHPDVLDAEFILKMNKCLRLFFKRLFRLKRFETFDKKQNQVVLKKNKNYCPDFGAVVHMSFLSRKGKGSPHSHFDCLVWSPELSGARVVRAIWYKVTKTVMSEPSRDAYYKKGERVASCVLDDVIKAQQYLNPDTVVSVIRAVHHDKKDSKGRRTRLVRFPQFFGVFSGRGKRHGR